MLEAGAPFHFCLFRALPLASSPALPSWNTMLSARQLTGPLPALVSSPPPH